MPPIESPASPRRVILASSSPYRRELLARLGIDFECITPDVDETRRPGEPAEALVRRLAEDKARACAVEAAGALVIGSDQVAALDDEVLGKPGGIERAREQLRRLSGRTVTFLTAVCLLDGASGETHHLLAPYRAVYRPLSDDEIERYLEREEPYNCAAGLRSERSGVSLLERMEGDDPTALMGLPLIELSRLLREAGFAVP